MLLPTGFTALKDVAQDGARVNVMGVVVHCMPPRESRGKDWCLDFTIQDKFGTDDTQFSTVGCRVFRPRKRLPAMSGVGDVAILRNARIASWGERIECLSDGTALAGVLVFHGNKIPIPELSSAYQTGSQNLQYAATWGADVPTIGEQLAVISLKAAASGHLPPIRPASQPTVPAATIRPSTQTMLPRAPYQPNFNPKLTLIKDLELSKFYDVRAQVLASYYSSFGDTVELKVTDYTENKDLFFYADPNSEDAFLVQHTNWQGPFGQFTLSVILYERNAAWARENLSVGDYVFLKNMRTKLSPANKLEGALHQDKVRVNQIDIRRLGNPSDIAEIDARRQAYEKKRGSKSALDGLKDARPVTGALSKKAEKKKQMRERKEADLREIAEMEEARDAERNGVNPNIRASFPEIKLSTVSEILHNPALKARSPKYNDFSLPFVNCKHRTRVRVIDVYPPELVQFSHSTSDRSWYRKPSKNDPSHGEPRLRWEWGFVLLVEDAVPPPNTVAEKLRVVVGNHQAQGLLGLQRNASDLRNDKLLLKRLQERLFILWGNLMELKTEMRLKGSDLPLPPGDNRLQNKPFDCCIEEYGYEVPITEQNRLGCQRMFRLVNTFIRS